MLQCHPLTTPRLPMHNMFIHLLDPLFILHRDPSVGQTPFRDSSRALPTFSPRTDLSYHYESTLYFLIC